MSSVPCSIPPITPLLPSLLCPSLPLLPSRYFKEENHWTIKIDVWIWMPTHMSIFKYLHLETRLLRKITVNIEKGDVVWHLGIWTHRSAHPFTKGKCGARNACWKFSPYGIILANSKITAQFLALHLMQDHHKGIWNLRRAIKASSINPKGLRIAPASQDFAFPEPCCTSVHA